MSLQGEKRPTHPYPKELKTLGHHIRKRRLDLGLNQGEAATRIGAIRRTVSMWEAHDDRAIADKFLPGIYAFLGYRPDPLPESFPEKLRYWRQSLGLPRMKLSLALGFGHSVIRSWELGVTPKKELLERLNVFLEERLGVTL